MRVFMLGIAVAVTALMPAVSMADDQQIADFVKSRLQAEQQRGNLRGFNVDMRVDQGTVWFKGYVSTPEQEQLILKTAQAAGHLGVVQVVDDIDVQSAAKPAVEPLTMPTPASQAAYQEMPAQAAPVAMSAYQQPQRPIQQPVQQPIQQPVAAQPVQAPVQTLPASDISNQPLAFASSPLAQQPAGAPVPAMGAGYNASGMGAPNMPGYSWPAYAAHPNYAAVTYPRQYSPSAWPYIGPFYPYPQVPLGWRRVSLEWDDGWWYLDFQDKSNW